MEYYNESENQNHKMIKIKNIKNYKDRAYKHSSTDNILKNNTLHKINNKFLINPYLVRNSRYINALNNINYIKEEKKYFNNNYNNIQNIQESIKENKKEVVYDKSNELNNYLNLEDSHDDNINNNNINKKENTIKNVKSIRNKIFNEENKNGYKEDYKINLLKNNKIKEFPKIESKYIHNTIERPIEYNIIYKNNDNDMYYSNNNNRLSLSYDIKRRKFDDQYISPVIAKIAKHNYLMRNPYSDKEQYLGPSHLKNNPILYPISTYKFDFNRYIRNYHVNKFV